MEHTDTLTPITVNESVSIDLHEDFRISEWCEFLNCSPMELQKAVGVVGTNAESVRVYIERQRRQQRWVG